MSNAGAPKPYVGTDEEQGLREEQAIKDLFDVPFVDVLFGRRSRRFFRGAEVPDGPLAFKSRHEPIQLTELERLLILTATAGNTGWHHSITRHERYAPHLANYPGAAGGPPLSSPAGFPTHEHFFPHRSGADFFPPRAAPAPPPPGPTRPPSAHGTRTAVSPCSTW